MKPLIKIRRKISNQKGFTLIEMLIIIIILGILTLIGLPKLSIYKNDSKAREILSTAETIGRTTEAQIATLNESASLSIDDIPSYFTSETAARIGSGKEFNITITDFDVTVTYEGAAVHSKAIGNIDPGDVIYPVFTAN